MIAVSKEIVSNLEAARSREWLETNGLGGFASSTICGMNTRRYHGLLTAATKPPVGRIVMLSKLEETLIIDGQRYELSTNQYPGTIHPRGFEYQTGFRLDPFPVFVYEIEGLIIEKSLFMVQGENTTVVQYDLRVLDKPKSVKGLKKATTAKGGESLKPLGREFYDVKLEVRPLIAFRDYHSTTHENGGINAIVVTEDGMISMTPYVDLPALHFAHDPAELAGNGFWFRNFEYEIERERGLDFMEDLFSPFALTFDLNRERRARIIASTNRHNTRNAVQLRTEEIARRTALAATTPEANGVVSSLASVADQFIVARHAHKTVIAGYPWFSDWGRDTMIALPGLTLATGRPEVARSILLEFSEHVNQGMLPNRFPDAGEIPEYNTVDATLWFFEAVRSLLQYTNDLEFVQTKLYEVLKSIIDWHVRGTRYNIRVDTDGLLYSGGPGVQLTWMDAKVGDWVVTPRQGKPVEIQALWYNALRVMESLAHEFGDKGANRYAAMAELAHKSFNKQFWNRETRCLFDVVDGDQRDGAIRPNQVIAISLRNSMVSKEKAKSILQVVERELLTPRGLRTLSPNDPQYRGRYEGNPLSRDGAYHQGTVWPWLIGPYLTAYVKTFGAKAGRTVAADWLINFQDHLEESCLGQVSEIFDGDSPHTPRGCIAQAWSVAEILRAAVEDV
jgi:predicted glycogen debranching enzyme